MAEMRVTLYAKEDCSLCDEARQQLQALQGEIPHQLVEIDINSEPRLAERYGDQVPVVQAGPYTLVAPFDRRDLQVTLSAARDGQQPDESQRSLSQGQAVGLNKALLFFSRHWLAALNLVVLMYVGLPFVAPTLMRAGVTGPAQLIYRVYSPLCHQLAFRSWFLYGEQAAYPRELAGTSYEPYGQVTGMPETDLIAAREFVGSEAVGYKVALCERDIGIYGGIFLAGLVFAFVRHRARPLPLVLWALFGIVPIALDGGSQLVSGIPLPLFDLFPARESTPLLRTLTGGLFGIMNVWMAYPYLEETMAETRAIISAKLDAAGLSGAAPSE